MEGVRATTPLRPTIKEQSSTRNQRTTQNTPTIRPITYPVTATNKSFGIYLIT